MFEGKLAIVTGGARGHGKEMVIQLTKKNATVIILDVNENDGIAFAEELKENGHEAKFYKVDVTNGEEIENMVLEVINQYGHIDILVNNAGITQAKPLEDITPEEWDRMLDINLKGPFLMIKNVLKHMKERKYGRIINISSIAAVAGGGYIGTSHYAASKAGIIGLTKAAAKESARFGITVNAIAPGLCETPMTDALLSTNNTLANTIPAGRVGQTKDISNTVLFLASESSDYITGQTIFVDGGVSIGSSKVID